MKNKITTTLLISILAVTNCINNINSENIELSKNKLIKKIEHKDPGPDNKWLTEDDWIYSYTQYKYKIINSEVYTYTLPCRSPGDDEVWFTTDDVFTSYTDSVERHFENGSIKQSINTTYTLGEDKIVQTADDTMQSYTLYEYNKNGKAIKQVNGKTYGPDGIPYNNDDEIYSYYINEYNEAGNLTKNVKGTGPGKDGILFNNDDEINSYMIFEYNEAGDMTSNIQAVGPGKDGLLFNEDDEITYYHLYYFNNNGQKTKEIYAHGPGPDGINFTNDDDGLRYFLYEYKINRLSITKISQGPGDDGVYFTYDDIYSYYINDYDEDGVNFRTRYYPPGTEEIIFEDINKISTYSMKTFNRQGKTTEFKSYSGPGDDGKWYTDDDNLSRIITKEYNDYGDMIKRLSIYYSKGKDNIWNTEDDEKKYTLIEFNTFKQYILKDIQCKSAGPDNDLFTSDDIFNRYTIKEYNNEGNMTLYLEYIHPGKDGTWLTGDDMRDHQIYEYDEIGRLKFHKFLGHSCTTEINFYTRYIYND